MPEEELELSQEEISDWIEDASDVSSSFIFYIFY